MVRGVGDGLRLATLSIESTHPARIASEGALIRAYTNEGMPTLYFDNF